MPAGLDSDGKSLGGQRGPAFLRAAGRRSMRRWVTDEHGEQFGKGEAGMLHDKWLDEMVAFSAGLGGRGRGISWLPGRVEEIDVLLDSRRARSSSRWLNPSTSRATRCTCASSGRNRPTGSSSSSPPWREPR